MVANGCFAYTVPPCCVELQPLHAILHLLLQRILNVEYGFPAQVEISDNCKDLLTRILVADPAERMSIPQIMQHPWYGPAVTTVLRLTVM